MSAMATRSVWRDARRVAFILIRSGKWSTSFRQLALRIGLAARALPNVTPKFLVELLIEVLKLPLTDAKLKALTIYQLRTAKNGALKSVPRQVLSAACAYLRDKAAVDIIDTSLPDIVAYEEGDMRGSIRLAIATDRGLNVNAHFGSCLRFLVYQVSATLFGVDC